MPDPPSLQGTSGSAENKPMPGSTSQPVATKSLPCASKNTISKVPVATNIISTPVGYQAQTPPQPFASKTFPYTAQTGPASSVPIPQQYFATKSSAREAAALEATQK